MYTKKEKIFLFICVTPYNFRHRYSINKIKFDILYFFCKTSKKMYKIKIIPLIKLLFFDNAKKVDMIYSIYQ